MLSPHIDHLFDQGYITFEDDGSLVASLDASPEVFKAWGIEAAKDIKPFKSEQAAYLAYHRQHIFRR